MGLIQPFRKPPVDVRRQDTDRFIPCEQAAQPLVPSNSVIRSGIRRYRETYLRQNLSAAAVEWPYHTAIGVVSRRKSSLRLQRFSPPEAEAVSAFWGRTGIT